MRSAKVSGDVDELRAAFSNLLDNAVKYSDEEVQVSVSVSALDEKRVAVRVTDKGIGIPSAQLKRIFKRFYRVPGSLHGSSEGHWPRTLHCSFSDYQARRPRVCRK